MLRRNFCAALAASAAMAGEVRDEADQIVISTPKLDAAIRKRGYVSGVAAGSLRDRESGFHDAGFGLDIVDWIMASSAESVGRLGFR